jgi:hypothetical protein
MPFSVTTNRLCDFPHLIPQPPSLEFFQSFLPNIFYFSLRDFSLIQKIFLPLFKEELYS